MRLVTWRHLFLAFAVGTLTYFACKSWWPEPKPWASVAVPELRSDADPIKLSADASLIAFTIAEEQNRTLVIRSVGGTTVVSDPRRNCVFSPKGDVFALYDYEFVELFGTRDGKPVPGSRRSLPQEARALCLDDGSKIHALIFDGKNCSGHCLEENSPTKRIDGAFVTDWPPHNHLVTVLANNGEYHVWDYSTGQEIGRLGPRGAFSNNSISADGKTVLVEGTWDPAHIHYLKKRVVLKLPLRVYKSSLSPNGAQAAGVVHILEKERDEGPKWFQRLKKFLGIAASDDTWRNGITLFDTTSGAELAYFDRGYQAIFSRDGKTLAVYRDGKLDLWRLPLRSAVPYWAAISIAVALGFFAMMRRAHRRRQARHITAAPSVVSA